MNNAKRMGIIKGKVILSDDNADLKVKHFHIEYEKPVLARDLIQKLIDNNMPSFTISALEEKT